MQVIIKEDGVKVSSEQARVMAERARARAQVESISPDTLAGFIVFVFRRESGEVAAYVTADHVTAGGRHCGEFIGNISVSDIFEKSVDTVV